MTKHVAPMYEGLEDNWTFGQAGILIGPLGDTARRYGQGVHVDGLAGEFQFGLFITAGPQAAKRRKTACMTFTSDTFEALANHHRQQVRSAATAAR
jgi:hypothetical protein